MNKKEKCFFCEQDGDYFSWFDSELISICLKHLSSQLVS